MNLRQSKELILKSKLVTQLVPEFDVIVKDFTPFYNALFQIHTTILRDIMKHIQVVWCWIKIFITIILELLKSLKSD